MGFLPRHYPTGVEFLALVVDKCPPESFNLQSGACYVAQDAFYLNPSNDQVKVLVAFFTSKLEDTETIIPALKGILAITRIPTLIPDNVVDICAA
jgi:DNA repair/transcription protein MET18/MMS19